MLEASDHPRAHYRTLFEQIQTLPRADFDERCGMRDRAFSDRGVTFVFSGEEERPFPLDLVPRIISALEWPTIEKGVGQRVRALERFLADVYGPGETMRDRVVPRRLVANYPARLLWANGMCSSHAAATTAMSRHSRVCSTVRPT